MTVFLEHGKPLIFGQNDDKGVRLDGLTPDIVELTKESLENPWIHDENDKTKANLISRFFATTFQDVHFPRPFGIIYTEERPTYNEKMEEQLISAKNQKGKTRLNKILSGDKTWNIL